MANPERGRISREEALDFWRKFFSRPGKQPTMPEAVAPVRLTDQGKTLAAMLSAYDAQQVGMTPEEKEDQNRRVVTGEEDVIVSGEELQRRRAGVQISQDSSKSMDQAMKDVKDLEEASKTIPGIKGLLRMLAEDKGEEEK